MDKMTRMRAHLPDADERVLDAMLADAAAAICAYTNRDTVPESLEGIQVRLAIVYYNRMGTEGEVAHSEGGVSRSMDAFPADIAAMLRPHRLAKVVGMTQGGGVL